jgi:hypothetical protein
MSKASEKINKRQVVMADGRYLIFYTFEAPDGRRSSHCAHPITDAKAATRPSKN